MERFAMKNTNRLPIGFLILFLGFSFFFFQGCMVSQYHVPPVTVAQIVEMSKSGVAPKDIIDKIKKSRTVYRLKADQLVQLEKEGVSTDVLDYMQKTYLDSVRQNQQLEDWNYWWPGWDGYWYGGPAFGWPWGYWRWHWGAGIDFD
jgi:hypothetical protein